MHARTLLIALSLPILPALALDPPAAVADPGPVSLLDGMTDTGRYQIQSLTLYWDNDGTYPNFAQDTDRYYTSAQGFEIGLSFDATGLADRLAPGWTDPRFAAAVGVEQHIYTATDITVANPPANDHPYGGWLSLNLAFQRADATRHDHFELDLGVVGQWSGAEAVQKFIHSVVPEEVTPQGWPTQLGNELAINFTYERTWRTEPAKVRGVAFDMLPAAGFDLGNVFIRARGKATLRFGYNLPDDFGPPSLLGHADHTAPKPEGDWSVYVYATGGADAVARNIFLDGNTFSDSRSTDREDLVARFTLGLFARWKLAYLGWSQTWETKTFDAEPNGQTFGSIVLGCRWVF